MSRPLLIGSVLTGMFTATALHAEEPGSPQFQPALSGQTPPWAQQDMPSAPPAPTWVEERRARLGVREAPRPAEAPAGVAEAPAAPRTAMDDPRFAPLPAPQPPEAPRMDESPEAPDLPAEPLPARPSAPGIVRGAPYGPWGGVPHGGWGAPSGGRGPWGNGWGHSGWMPWGSGWGNDGWWPWGGGWGGDPWRRGYGSGWGDRGRGNAWGDALGDASGEADITVEMRAWMSGDFTGSGDGYGYGDGRARGYGHRGYGPWGAPYGPPPMPMPMPMQAPAAPAPEEPEGPADGDGDGVSDASDLCPDTAEGATVDVLGCDDAARIVLRGVNFKTDSDELTPESLAILDGVSATLAANPEVRVMVAGHTDSDGDETYNKDLSQRRAQSVVNHLVSQGVNRDNLIAKGYGEAQPIASNEAAEGKAQNRRVELNRL